MITMQLLFVLLWLVLIFALLPVEADGTGGSAGENLMVLLSKSPLQTLVIPSLVSLNLKALQTRAHSFILPCLVSHLRYLSS